MSRIMTPAGLTLAVFLQLAVSHAIAQTSPSPVVPQTAPVQPAPASAPALTLQQIIEKNAAARGGLSAWREIQSMSESGKMDAGGNAKVQLPFVLKLKRPRKSRLEIEFNNQTAVQTYDGSNGWTLRPYLGRTDPEPFTPEEMKKAVEQQDLDGPLIDYAAKGTQAELIGVEQVDGRDAYKIKLILSRNAVRHVWIDAQSFLEIKMEAPPRIMNGRPRQVTTWFRDYRTVNGLAIPFVLETAVQGVIGRHRISIEKVELNPALDDQAFGKPQSVASAALLSRSRAVIAPVGGKRTVKR